MMNVAFIPVRGGSKSIPLKNIKMICGKPLVYWTIKAACECNYINKVYVATDNSIIANTINSFKVECRDFIDKLEVIGRSEESATDTASTEFAMLEFAEKYYFDNIVLIQATSPLLSSGDLTNGFKIFANDDVDSVISVVRQKRFNWQVKNDGFVCPTNYNIYRRPRRQEFDGYFVENGAFYISSKKALLESKNRISGNIKAVEMCEESFWEIDEPSDWLIIEQLLKKKNTKSFSDIKMVLTDCDGCLTDGGMYYSENDDEIKKFNTRDGMAFQILKEHNIFTGIITGENVSLVQRRADKMKLDILILGCKNKAAKIKEIANKYNISLKNILYIGDDVNDIEALNIVGVSCCPNDAVDKVRSMVDYISPCNGGHGVIRNIVDLMFIED